MIGHDDNAAIVYNDEATELWFVWYGGAYIDVTYMHDGSDPFDVINVWDDSADVSFFETAAMGEGGGRRPFRTVLELFEERCRAWARENAEPADVDA